MTTPALMGSGAVVSTDVVRDYMRTISSTTVLSRDEVARLCQAIEIGVLASDRSQRRTTSPRDRRDLAELQQRGVAAQRKLVAHNLKLVVSIARKASSRSIDFEDLIQAGNAGLVTAVQRFDWTLGFAFSTYASWWIKKAISLEVANDRTIRLPAGPLRDLLALVRIERESAEMDAPKLSVSDLAEASGLDPARVATLRRAGSPILSLAQPLMSDHEVALMDVLRADSPDLDEALHDRVLFKAMESALVELPRVSRSILELRYGLTGEPPRTPQRIAQLTHIPVAEILLHERVSLEELGRKLRSLHDS